MHLEIIVRDGQKRVGTIGVRTFESDLYVALIAMDTGQSTRVAMPVDCAEIDALISALRVARKNVKLKR